LLVDLEELSLLDVMEAISGELIMDTCQVKPRCATQARKGYCRLKTAWLGTTLGIRELLAQVKLSQLADRG
jgi:DNA-binding IscR family transcriptional regulator